MKRAWVLGLLLLLSVSCAASRETLAGAEGGHRFHRYAACVERMVGGRLLHDTGWVVGERDVETGTHLFSFLSNYWGKVIEVARVNRFCNAVRSRLDGRPEAPAEIGAQVPYR